jgi:tRNA A-37 threonylcarbamoyl transferase component Bud32
VTAIVGTRLDGRYRIEELIGSGGMSTVYRAFDETLEREVAIKILHSEISRDPASIERFAREARTVAQLSHPNVVMVIDAGEDGENPYIVFEHVRGETLKQRVRREGPLPISEAIAYAIEIGRALWAAHQRGLVHRDIKPQNVMIDQEGRAKVTDFGIARGLESKQLTAVGKVVGTTDYVSPEQALGHDVGSQSDIYSLGIVLYEMLTGEVPFKGSSSVSVAMKHVQEGLPDVQRRRTEVSAALAAVIEQATAKELGNRYGAVAEMVADLEQCLTYESAREGGTTGEATAVLNQLPQTVRARSRWRRHLLAIAVYVLIAGAVTAAAVVLFSNRGSGKTQTPVPANLVPIGLGDRDALDYDPAPGDEQENTGQLPNLLDGDPDTSWTTERYDTDRFANLKDGTGAYLDAGRPVVARALRIVTPKPGWSVELYVSKSSVPSSVADWTQVGGGEVEARRETFGLDTGGQAFQYYLIWITKLTDEPNGRYSAGISKLQLLG